MRVYISSSKAMLRQPMVLPVKAKIVADKPKHFRLNTSSLSAAAAPEREVSQSQLHGTHKQIALECFDISLNQPCT
jgi:hypothetical protein